MRFHLGCLGDWSQVGGLDGEESQEQKRTGEALVLCSVVSLWVLTMQEYIHKEDLHSKEYYSALKKK